MITVLPAGLWAPTGMGKVEGALSSWNCCKMFLCIGSYSKTLSRRNIYHHHSKLDKAPIQVLSGAVQT